MCNCFGDTGIHASTFNSTEGYRCDLCGKLVGASRTTAKLAGDEAVERLQRQLLTGNGDVDDSGLIRVSRDDLRAALSPTHSAPDEAAVATVIAHMNGPLSLPDLSAPIGDDLIGRLTRLYAELSTTTKNYDAEAVAEAIALLKEQERG